jgi:predicted phosphodiesterase
MAGERHRAPLGTSGEVRPRASIEGGTALGAWRAFKRGIPWWRRRWVTLVVAAVALALVATIAAGVLADWRIRLHTLVRLDGPAVPQVLGSEGLVLSITGCRTTAGAHADRLVLRAWVPDPVIRVVEPGDQDEAVLRIENLAARAHLEASGPVEETRAGLVRTLRFSPRATRRLAFNAPVDEVRFAVLGDTGDAPTFVEALRVAAADGADFLLHVGDLIYEDEQMANIRRILASAPLAVYLVRGNHDYRNQARIDFVRAIAPPYYSFRIGRATFIVLDNADDYLPGLWRRSSQYRWWTSMMSESRDGPLFVAMHKPVFDRRGGRAGAAMVDRAFGRQLLNDFGRAGVDAVFTGHAHASHVWLEDGIQFVVNGEGHVSGVKRPRMGWVRVRGWQVQIEQVPIWR